MMYGEAGGSYHPPDWEAEAGEAGMEAGGPGEEEDLHHLDLHVVEQTPDYWHVLKLVKVTIVSPSSYSKGR